MKQLKARDVLQSQTNAPSQYGYEIFVDGSREDWEDGFDSEEAAERECAEVMARYNRDRYNEIFGHVFYVERITKISL